MSKQLEFKLSSTDKPKQLKDTLPSKEKFFLYGAIFIFLAALITWSINFYFSSTKKVPDQGGEYTEGIVGEPRYVNPILSQSNEVDAILCNTIFSSLLKYNSKTELVNDLATGYEISEDKKKYTLKIKDDVQWHDGEKLTAQDIYFTIKLIQDPNFKSSLRGDWQDVKIEAPDNSTIIFKLSEPYAPFLNKLTFGVLPRHIFEEIPADDFLLSDFNLKPVGSGPFVYSSFKQDEENNIISYQLIANENYYDKKPFLEKINFNFYQEEDLVIDAYSKKSINGFGVLSYEKIKDYEIRKDTEINSLRTPRYFAVFFNQAKSIPLASENVREALNYATNKEEMIQKVFHGYATEVNSPILGSFGEFSNSEEVQKTDYNPEKAKKILDEEGWESQDDGTRKKDDEVLEISLITTQWPALSETANLIKEQWGRIGVRVNVTELSIADIQQNFIKPREYQAILFGQEYFGNDPDPYNFWHSSGKKDPGSNIAMYGDEDVDELIKEARETSDLEKRKENYQKFEKIISEDFPAVFLYSPNYVYLLNKKIKGMEAESIINPALRFSEINEWFIKTKRVKK
jgi:peptide/nickel transport system substrate-binding protein